MAEQLLREVFIYLRSNPSYVTPTNMQQLIEKFNNFIAEVLPRRHNDFIVEELILREEMLMKEREMLDSLRTIENNN